MSAEEKSALRTQYRELYCKPRANRSADSAVLCENIANSREFKVAKRVGIFLGRDWEPDFLPLWKGNTTKCAAPRVDDEQMTFYFFSTKGSLKTGYASILAPAADPAKLCLFEDGDIVLVPGLAFDRSGGRLGYGKGFYDKYLATLSVSVRRWGICFDDQLLRDPLPMEPHDIRMQALITPRGQLLFHKR